MWTFPTDVTATGNCVALVGMSLCMLMCSCDRMMRLVVYWKSEPLLSWVGWVFSDFVSDSDFFFFLFKASSWNLTKRGRTWLWGNRSDKIKRPWCWERLKAGGEGYNRGWDGWMASLAQCTWVWVAPGIGDGQGNLVCWSPWGRKESDLAEWLNWLPD